MIRWLGYELKSMLKNKKNILIFIVVLAINFVAFSFIKSDSDIASEYMDMYNSAVAEDELNGGLEICDPITRECEYQGMMDLELLKDLSEGNFDESNKQMIISKLDMVDNIETYLLNMKNTDHPGLKEKVEHYFHNHDIHLELKQKIKEKYGYENDQDSIVSSTLIDIYNVEVNSLQYIFEVADQGYTLYPDQPSKSSLTVVLTALRSYYMVLILAVPLLVSFDVISKDQKSGVLKTYMTLGQSRYKYLFVKITASFLTSMIILFLPLFVMLLVNNVHVIKDLRYPNFVYTDGIKNLKGLNPAVVTQTAENQTVPFSYHSHSLVILDKFGFPIGIDPGVTLQTLGLTLLLSFVLISLLVWLLISLQIGLSVNTNKFIGFLGVLGIVAFLYFLTTLKPDTYTLSTADGNLFPGYEFEQPSIIGIINPLSYLNVADVIEGTTSFTFLSGVLVMLCETSLIQFVCAQFFKKKDIKD